MLLSPHFSYAEMVRSQATDRLRLDNTPSLESVNNLRALCEAILEPLRAGFGDRAIAISSGYRSVSVNALVGGAPSSRHTTGEAADIEVPGVSNLVVARWIEKSGLPFDELILEYYALGQPSSGWVHVAHRQAPRRNAGKVLTVTKKGVTRGLPWEPPAPPEKP